LKNSKSAQTYSKLSENCPNPFFLIENNYFQVIKNVGHLQTGNHRQPLANQRENHRMFISKSENPLKN
jgi:phage anti-repressor protein